MTKRLPTSQLALHGGPPVREMLLPYGRQWIDEEEIAAVVEVLRSDWLTTGPKVVEFEEAVAEYVGARYAVAFSSGTAALHAAAHAAGIGPGDEVITTPLTFAATANCVLYQGGKPVFADIDEQTLNLDPAEVERSLTPRTKAIIAVDFAGHPAELDELRALARERHLLLIEDACHALGAEYRGQKIGGLSDLTVFSFHPVKHITTGEGGMITTHDEALAERLRLFRNHGISVDAQERQRRGAWFYEMIDLGYNYRLTDLQCALGLSQLRKLDRFLSRRAEIAARYREAFANVPEIILPTVAPQVKHAWHLFVIQLRLERLTAGRAEIFQALRAENIGVNVHYIPVHWHPYYQQQGYCSKDCPKAGRYYERAITLPLFPRMQERDVEEVIAAVQKVVHHFRKEGETEA
jgi:UDP-4-amino-4,6-dideoxy-N-acetyl-beta-L-altrosamine transaminase